jgi:ElaB/YqjD/DUF883 family membrane-anchored ribosome-binding protein
MPTPTSIDPEFTSRAEDHGSQATSRTAEFGQRAAAAIDEKREAVARGFDSAASSLHAKAESLPGGEKIASAARTTAEAMEKTADYVRDQDVEGMISDAGQVLKKHPGAVLLTAAAVGFLLARALSRG